MLTLAHPVLRHSQTLAAVEHLRVVRLFCFPQKFEEIRKGNLHHSVTLLAVNGLQQRLTDTCSIILDDFIYSEGKLSLFTGELQANKYEHFIETLSGKTSRMAFLLAGLGQKLVFKV